MNGMVLVLIGIMSGLRLDSKVNNYHQLYSEYERMHQSLEILYNGLMNGQETEEERNKRIEEKREEIDRTINILK